MPNKVISIDQASTPATFCSGLFENHEHIDEIFACVVWKGGEVRTYHTKMTQANLLWLVRRANADVEGSMFGDSE